MDKKNTMLLTVIAIATLLVAVVGATFAYFSVTATNNATNTTVQGSAQSSGAITFQTITPNLYIKLDATHMAQDVAPITYYATTAVEGTPITEAANGVFTLASANVASGDTHYKCTYGFTVTAELAAGATISDGSDEDVKVKISGSSITKKGETAVTDGYVEYTLKELIAAGTTGLKFSGEFADLTPGVAQELTIQSTVENTEESQDNLAGKSYTITVTPAPGVDENGFSCVAI